MRIIGLTGGIACGKSTVAAVLVRFGALVSDADALAREAVAPGSPGLRAVAEEFGQRFLTPDGELDRAKVASLVFGDPAARARLEGIVHPLVRRATEKQLDAWRKAGVRVAVVMAPLLLEAGMDALVDELWVVVTPPAVQMERLARRGLAPAAASARIAAQWSQEEKRQRADVVIVNDGSTADLVAKLADIWEARFSPGNPAEP